LEAAEIADNLADPIGRLSTHSNRMQAALEAGDLATMRNAFSIYAAEVERTGQPYQQWALAFYRAMRSVLEGDPATTEEAANDALTLGTASGQPDAFAYYGAQLTNVRWMQGRAHELIPLIEQAVKDNPGLPAFRAGLVWAKSYDDNDKDNEVSTLLDAEVASNFAMSEDSQWLMGHVLWAEAAARRRHRPAAVALYQILQPWHAQIVTTYITVNGSVAHYLGLLAHALHRNDEADRWFAEALACHERMEAPYFVALTQTAWASLLSDRNGPGDAQRARAFIDAALPVAAERGYGYVERDARALGERLG
jgi:tetratricopeptide (TPR) repeat protein